MSSIYSINKNNTQTVNRRETLSLLYKPTTEPDRLAGLRDDLSHVSCDQPVGISLRLEFVRKRGKRARHRSLERDL